MKHITRVITCLLFVLIMASCKNNGVIETIEVTRLFPQTVEVTKVISQTAIVNQLVQLTATTTPQQTTSTPGVSPVLETEYYAGTVVITQYYTFLGHGLYEEAYQLLSSSAQQPHSLDEYLQMAKLSFKAVEIVSIMPYYLEVRKAGGHANPDQEVRKKLFFVQIKAWGEGNMSGSRMNGDLQSLFLGLVNENGQWKIDSFATAPFH